LVSHFEFLSQKSYPSRRQIALINMILRWTALKMFLELLFTWELAFAEGTGRDLITHFNVLEQLALAWERFPAMTALHGVRGRSFSLSCLTSNSLDYQIIKGNHPHVPTTAANGSPSHSSSAASEVAHPWLNPQSTTFSFPTFSISLLTRP